MENVGLEMLLRELDKVNDKVEKGAAFEELCKLYLKSIYAFVWSSGDDVPLGVVAKEEIFEGRDTGIDLYCVNNSGDIWGVQCKAVGEGKSLSKSGSKIDSFFADCGRRRIKNLMVITTAQIVSKNVKDLIDHYNCMLITSDDLGKADVKWPESLPVQEKYLTFDKAREYARKQGLRNVKAWKLFCKNGKRNNRFSVPTNPNEIYKNKGWISWGDFLGTGNVSTAKKKYRGFGPAHQFVLNLKIKNEREWRGYCNSGKMPKDLPTAPNKTYRGKGWISFPHWLTGKEKVEFMGFEEARDWAHKSGIKSSEEWKKKVATLPRSIPRAPEQVYFNNGWKGWGDFLGTGNVSKKEWRDFNSAHQFILDQTINNKRGWFDYCDSGNKPNDIPITPDSVYRGKGWISWPHWLTGKEKIEYMSFEEARKWAHESGIKSQSEWAFRVREGKIPSNIPKSTYIAYREKGWKGWEDFLGKHRWLSFKEAHKWAKESGITSIREWKRCGDMPEGVPRTPEKVYISDWKGWGDWLGYRR